MTHFSALDVAPVWNGTTVATAIRGVGALAVALEPLGYRRFWIGEHHNTPSLTATATAVLVGQVASRTKNLRVGSGDVLLPNHPPLVVAEQFGTLEALHPGRIDLGVGRASGTDSVTAPMLSHTSSADDLDPLRAFLCGSADDPVVATPALGQSPPVFLLGTSPGSAVMAGRAGLPYAFAHHINPAATAESLEAYRASFVPTDAQPTPLTILAAFVLVAPDDVAARRLVSPYVLGKLWMRSRRMVVLPSWDDVKQHAWTSAELDFAETWAARQLVGGPETVSNRLGRLLRLTGADEVMGMTLTPDHQDRVASYQRLALIVTALSEPTHRGHRVHTTTGGTP